MTREELQSVLQELVEGRVPPDEWAHWWSNQAAAARSLLSPGHFLRLNRSAKGTPSLSSVAGSQQAAAKILGDWEIPFTLDPTYLELAETERRTEVEEIKREWKKERKLQRERVRREIPRFAAYFPEFADLLKRRTSDVEDIGASMPDSEVQLLEAQMGLRFPPSFRRFLSIASSVRIGDTFHLSRDTLFCVDHRSATAGRVLVFADFWWHADGDQAVFDPEGTEWSVHYYSHEDASLNSIAPTFDEFLRWLSKRRGIWS